MTIRSAAGGLRLLRLTIVGALLTLIVSSGAGVTATDLARQHAALKPVTVATLRIEPGALAFYAKDEGFFARQGLDVKVLPLSDPSQLAAALLSGDVQFSGFNIGGAAILKSRSAPVKVVAAGALYRPADPTTAVVAARGKRIAGARDLIGKTIAIDAQNTIAHIGLLKWLKANRVSASHVHLTEIPFAQMLGPLRRGTVDAALLPEPFVTLALQRGATRIGDPFRAVCAQDCLLTVWLARNDVDPTVAARFRNAVQAAAVWANKKRNDAASGAIVAKYVGINRALIAEEARTRFAERLRPALAQPWIDAFAEFGAIPASFQAIDLVK